jgi:hypothetical protein
VPYQGGYCTLDCSATGACPVGSTCANMGGLFGETFTLCIAACGGQPSPCREPGYACYALGPGSPPPTGCWIDPPAPDGLEGASCNVSSDCLTSTGPGQGFCTASTLADGGPSGFPGGMCGADCTGWEQAGLGDLYCGDGGTCVFFGDAGFSPASCFGSCATPLGGQATCRVGYVCRPSPEGGGFCYPRCDNRGGSCPTGTACSANGYCCDAGTCI